MKRITEKLLTTEKWQINREDIISALVETGRIPSEANVKNLYFKVPGGGDYSNCAVEIQGEENLTIVFEREVD